MSIHWGGRGAGHVSRWSLATTGAPALSLNFLSGTLDSRITFTRGTTATFVGSNGLIQSAAINTPRFDYDPVTLAPKGLLIEEARTNLLLRSEEFDNATWAKSAFATVTANTTSAPSGATTADTLAANTATTANPAEVFQAQTLAINTQYAYSMFAKKNTSNFIALRHTAVLGNPYAWFNLNTGTVATVQAGLTATITPFENGWYRCTVVGTTAAVIAVNRVDALVSDNDGNFVCASGGSIFLYGADLEAGAFATSYIPTVAATVTRNADLASMTSTNFSSWYNAAQGTFVVSADTFVPESAFPHVFSVSDGTAAETIFSRYVAGSSYVVTDNSSNQAVFSLTSPAANVPQTRATAFAANDFAVSVSGGAVQTDTSGSIPTVDRMFIGAKPNGSSEFINGHIRSIAYYKTRLYNSQLQTLSQ